jgi:hypothetical protein
LGYTYRTMTSINIVELIENNPITKFSGNYQSRLVGKLRESFTEQQQQLFLSSFYCYLNCDKTEFVIDLDDVWKWMGFLNKANAKRCLEKYFIADKDYANLLIPKDKQDSSHGGHNKQVIKMTVAAFKRFCLKAGTSKADEIHEYYIRLEEVLQETICEESAELQKQLTEAQETHCEESAELQKQLTEAQETHETDKIVLREKTIVSQFPINTQCFYYGTIANVSGEGEPLVKFGMSNNLKSRQKAHRKTYDNFRLVNAFRVSNKTEAENAVKADPAMAGRIRSIVIKNKSFTELISMTGLSFADLDRELKRVFAEVEYNRENYTKLQETVKALRCSLEEANKDNYMERYHLAESECKRLRAENRLVEKRYNALSRNHTEHRVLTAPITNDTNVCRDLKRVFHEDGSRTIDGVRYNKTMGTREEVFRGTAYNTSGRLHKEDLTLNQHGKIVSIRKSIQATVNDRLGGMARRGVGPPPTTHR